LPTSEVNKYGIRVDSLAMEMGFRTGDRILSVDEIYVEDFQKIPVTMILNESKTIQVLRDGKELSFTLPSGSLNKLIKHKSPLFLSVRMPFVANGFGENSIAEKAGLKVGDSLIGINEMEIRYYVEFRNKIQEFKNQDVVVVVKRGDEVINLPMRLDETGLMGVYGQNNINNFFEINKKQYGIVEAIPAGFNRTWKGIDNYFKQLKLMFSPEVKAYEGVGGFGMIASIFPTEWHWQNFWRLTAFLSIMLAILNVLPIPALDGGHVMFLLYEIIARRKPSDKFLEYSQVVGMVLLFSLLIYANGMDVFRAFFNN
jgi:regulator of sigma E protease